MITIVILTRNVFLIHILQLNHNTLWVTVLILYLCIAKFHWGKKHILRTTSAILFLRWNNGIISSLRLGIVELISVFLLWDVIRWFVGFYSIPFQDFSIVALRTIISLLFVFKKLVSDSSIFLFFVIYSLFACVDAKSWYPSNSFSSGLNNRFTSSFV